jgi:hypothetical protein
MKRRSGDHVVDREIVALSQRQSCLVRFDRDGMDGQQATEQRQKGSGVLPGHPHLAAGNIGQLVENLHADRAAPADDRFRVVGRPPV